MDLQNKVALVTGGAVRLGRALSLALGRSGVHLAVHYHSSASDAESVLMQLRECGVRAEGIQTDLSAPDAAQSVMGKVLDMFGRVDILVNSAAIFLPGTWRDTTEADWDTQFAINLRTPFFIAQAFARALGDQRGHIINIADWRATRPGVGHMAYTFTKAALVAMTQSLALAMAPNIQVNAIAPGAVLPPPGKGVEYLDAMARQVPLRRHGAPEDVAEAMLYLLRSDFTTGELLYVTGGQQL
jgi:pteridine reductase